MYLELAPSKLVILATGVVAILISIGAFLAMNGRLSLLSRARTAVSTTVWDSLYALRFDVLRRAFAGASVTEEPHRNTRAISVPVLLYHGESAAGNMPWSVFVGHMHALHDAGWRTISLDAFRDFIREGKSLPDKSFLLTFDDGRTDTYYPADPVLKDLGFTAVMFVITGFSLKEGGPSPSFYLDAHQLRTMMDSGRWELQSHGDQDHRWYSVQDTTDLDRKANRVQGHFISNKFWSDEHNRFETDSEFEERIRNDLVASNRDLADILGVEVYAFAYPFNDFGQESKNFPAAMAHVARVVSSLYTFAFYQVWPGNGDTFNYPGSGYMIKRIEPKEEWSSEFLLSQLEAGRAKMLPYQTTTFGTDWVTNWGQSTATDTVVLSASDETTGASIFLNGSGWWQNYRMDVTASFGTGDVSLIARNTNDDTFFACAFAKDQADLEERIRGEKRQIAQSRRTLVGDTDNVHLSIVVRGNRVSCEEEGVEIIAGSSAASELMRGGVGVSIWAPMVGVAHATIKNVSVAPL